MRFFLFLNIYQWALDWYEHVQSYTLDISCFASVFSMDARSVRECSMSDTTLSSVLKRGLSLVGLWNVAWWVGSKKLQDSYSAFAFSVSPFLPVSHSLSFLFSGSQMKNLLLAIRE